MLFNLRKKIVALNWTGLSSLLFRSQTPFAKKFQRFVNNYIFFDMFLHGTSYFDEHWDSDENCKEEYGSIRGISLGKILMGKRQKGRFWIVSIVNI